MAAGTKSCSKCKKIKPVSDFYKCAAIKSGYASQCKECHNKRNKEYRKKPEVKKHKREYMRTYESGRPEQVRNCWLQRKYGITLKEWNVIFEEQSGCCSICGTHQSELKTSLSTDHNHITKKVRGLLCQKCNDGLGRFCVDNGVELLYSAIKYIKERE